MRNPWYKARSLLYAGDTCWNTPNIPAGYWYASVPNDSSVSTTMASSTSVRTAFMAGMKLPPDDKVSYWSESCMQLKTCVARCGHVYMGQQAWFVIGSYAERVRNWIHRNNRTQNLLNTVQMPLPSYWPHKQTTYGRGAVHKQTSVKLQLIQWLNHNCWGCLNFKNSITQL